MHHTLLSYESSKLPLHKHVNVSISLSVDMNVPWMWPSIACVVSRHADKGVAVNKSMLSEVGIRPNIAVAPIHIGNIRCIGALLDAVSDNMLPLARNAYTMFAWHDICAACAKSCVPFVPPGITLHSSVFARTAYTYKYVVSVHTQSKSPVMLYTAPPDLTVPFLSLAVKALLCANKNQTSTNATRIPAFNTIIIYYLDRILRVSSI